MAKGREVRTLQRRPDTPPAAKIPTRAQLPSEGRDLQLGDGRMLVWFGRVPMIGEEGFLFRWKSADGLAVSASMDRTHHGRLLHVSCSYADHDPTWEEIKLVRAAFFPSAVDAMMLLPQAGDYINVQQHCFHLWQTPKEWGVQ